VLAKSAGHAWKRYTMWSQTRQVGPGDPGGEHQGGMNVASLAFQRGTLMKLPRRSRLAMQLKPGLSRRETARTRRAAWRRRCRQGGGFRRFQVCPKDLRELPGHPEPAVSWHSGFRGGAHARPKTTPVHYAAERRCGGVAARGARAATDNASDRVSWGC